MDDSTRNKDSLHAAMSYKLHEKRSVDSASMLKSQMMNTMKNLKDLSMQVMNRMDLDKISLDPHYQCTIHAVHYNKVRRDKKFSQLYFKVLNKSKPTILLLQVFKPILVAL